MPFARCGGVVGGWVVSPDAVCHILLGVDVVVPTCQNVLHPPSWEARFWEGHDVWTATGTRGRPFVCPSVFAAGAGMAWGAMGMRLRAGLVLHQQRGTPHPCPAFLETGDGTPGATDHQEGAMTGASVFRLDGDGNPIGARVEVVGFELTRIEDPVPDWDAIVAEVRNVARQMNLTLEMVGKGTKAWWDLIAALFGSPPRPKSPLLAAHRRRRHYG